MPTPDTPNQQPGGRPSRGLRAELDALIENWLERAEDADGDRGAEASELAAVFGFLRRTDARLLSDPEWIARRQRIEQRAMPLIRDPERAAALATALERLAIQLDGELLEFQAGHDRNDSDRPTAPAPSGAPIGVDLGTERIRAVRLAERVDRAMLAGVLALEARPENRDLLSKVESLSVRASHAGESFHLISRWFAAMDRSIDPMSRLTRWSFRGEYTLPADRALHAASAWIARSHARIRQYEADRRESATERRREAVIARIGSQPGSNEDRWEFVARLGSSRQARGSLDAHDFRDFQLLFRLAQSSAPILAAAEFAAVPAEFVEFEWTAPDAKTVARCRFAVGELSEALVVRFFDESGSLARSMDGKLAQWLGQSATVADGQARFPVRELQRSSAPIEVLERVRALFVGETPWSAEWDAPDEGASDPDELDR